MIAWKQTQPISDPGMMALALVNQSAQKNNCIDIRHLEMKYTVLTGFANFYGVIWNCM